MAKNLTVDKPQVLKSSNKASCLPGPKVTTRSAVVKAATRVLTTESQICSLVQDPKMIQPNSLDEVSSRHWKDSLLNTLDLRCESDVAHVFPKMMAYPFL